MTGYQDLGDFERGFIIGTRGMGHSISEVAMKFGFSRTPFHDFTLNIGYPVKHQISAIGAAGKRPRKNWTIDVRRESLNEIDVQYFLYATDFNDGASTSVRVRTVQRTVINMGSQSRRPTRVPFLTARYNALRLSWARQHHWTADDWKHVDWSGEFRFQFYRTYTCTSMETTSVIHPVCQQGTVQSGGASVMVWNVCS
ncbi:hypothetical protein AVEN_209306-1 [Araneus ventricosus]|uniref:Transposase Tc1-like domain-containing protein n=1 Tax=Araneus ventricosus TaxID=182803 RepID=A0A4Y2CDU9_ARAVE|nr:hypothetical protein AVEN_209306-1 [Araneus ventricosus]